MQEVVLIVFICVFSFFIGKLTAEKKEIEYEIEKFVKASAAGDRAVRAYKLRKQKQK